jgi:hypothetical protein
MVLAPSMFFGAPKALCTSWQSVAHGRASIAAINWGFLALLDCGTLTVTGQGAGGYLKNVRTCHICFVGKI